MTTVYLRQPPIVGQLVSVRNRRFVVIFVTENGLTEASKIQNLVYLSSVEDDAIGEDPAPALLNTLGAKVEVFVWPLENRPRNAKGQHGSLPAKFVVADGDKLIHLER
jgi:hypothetical protein